MRVRSRGIRLERRGAAPADDGARGRRAPDVAGGRERAAAARHRRSFVRRSRGAPVCMAPSRRGRGPGAPRPRVSGGLAGPVAAPARTARPRREAVPVRRTRRALARRPRRRGARASGRASARAAHHARGRCRRPPPGRRAAARATAQAAARRAHPRGPSLDPAVVLPGARQPDRVDARQRHGSPGRSGLRVVAARGHFRRNEFGCGSARAAGASRRALDAGTAHRRRGERPLDSP